MNPKATNQTELVRFKIWEHDISASDLKLKGNVTICVCNISYFIFLMNVWYFTIRRSKDLLKT